MGKPRGDRSDSGSASSSDDERGNDGDDTVIEPSRRRPIAAGPDPEFEFSDEETRRAVPGVIRDGSDSSEWSDSGDGGGVEELDLANMPKWLEDIKNNVEATSTTTPRTPSPLARRTKSPRTPSLRRRRRRPSGPEEALVAVGEVISVVGDVVVVQSLPGLEPMDEASVLCLETRQGLGAIEEVFGPVAAPLHATRVPAARRSGPASAAAGGNEAAAAGRETTDDDATDDANDVGDDVTPDVKVGARVFAVEGRRRALDTRGLRAKGYDNSGQNDEEVADDEEFSDDEREAEAKRKRKQKKRGAEGDARGGAARDGGLAAAAAAAGGGAAPEFRGGGRGGRGGRGAPRGRARGRGGTWVPARASSRDADGVHERGCSRRVPGAAPDGPARSNPAVAGERRLFGRPSERAPGGASRADDAPAADVVPAADDAPGAGGGDDTSAGVRPAAPAGELAAGPALAAPAAEVNNEKYLRTFRSHAPQAHARALETRSTQASVSRSPALTFFSAPRASHRGPDGVRVERRRRALVRVASPTSRRCRACGWWRMTPARAGRTCSTSATTTRLAISGTSWKSRTASASARRWRRSRMPCTTTAPGELRARTIPDRARSRSREARGRTRPRRARSPAACTRTARPRGRPRAGACEWRRPGAAPAQLRGARARVGAARVFGRRVCGRADGRHAARAGERAARGPGFERRRRRRAVAPGLAGEWWGESAALRVRASRGAAGGL